MRAAALGARGGRFDRGLLTRNHRDGKLHTYFIAEHHLGLPIEQDILLVLDSWEHAFMVDYGIKRPDYINAFLENINWAEVSRRFAKVASSPVPEPPGPSLPGRFHMLMPGHLHVVLQGIVQPAPVGQVAVR